jgi:hypothetical protein
VSDRDEHKVELRAIRERVWAKRDEIRQRVAPSDDADDETPDQE